MDISEPKCSKCRWHKEALNPRGGRIGLQLDHVFYMDGGNAYTSIGAVYCEHTKQPRGLVLTNYSCPNFERAPEVDDQLTIEHQRDNLLP